MSLDEQRAILALCLHAAFADGVKDDRERKDVNALLNRYPKAHLASIWPACIRTSCSSDCHWTWRQAHSPISGSASSPTKWQSASGGLSRRDSLL